LILAFGVLIIHYFVYLKNMEHVEAIESTLYDEQTLLNQWHITALDLVINPAVPISGAVLNRIDSLIERLNGSPHHTENKSVINLNRKLLDRLRYYTQNDTFQTSRKSFWTYYTFVRTALADHIAGEHRYLSRLHRENGTKLLIFLIGVLLMLHLILVFLLRPIAREVDKDYQLMEKERDDAVAANNAKSRYLSTMSHVIRTPLNGVLAMTDLLLETDLTFEQRDYLGIVQASGKSLLSVISDILDFSRIESNQLELITMNFDLKQLVDQVVAGFDDEIGEKDIQLIVFFEPDVPNHILGDPKRLHQILSNLLSNSIKFTRKGEVVLRVSVQPGAQNNQELLFSVSDTGMGIPEEKQKTLFMPFKESGNLLERRFEGTGLGLALSARLVALMGGAIWCESEINKGSTFYFTLPLKKATGRITQPAREDDSLRIPEQPAGISAPLSDSQVSVLLAEDNTINQRLMERLMERIGYKLDVARDGREAVKMASKKKYDIIFMDLQMPEMDGIEATRHILSEAGEPKPQIIAMTANVSREDKELCLKTGMVDYVAKPVSPDKIKEVMRKYHR